MVYENELKLAINAASSAGEFLKKREGVLIDSYEGKDIKLSSDKNSEKIIFDVLRESNIPILSEESSENWRKEDKYWIVDPLDGTMNYYKGMDDLSCVSIALWDDGRPVVGVINRYSRNELFSGCVNGKAYLNGKEIQTSDIKEMKQAVMSTGFPVKRAYDTDSLMNFVKQVQELSGNEIVFEDAVTKIDPEVEESGQGTCEISFKCNGKPYSFTAVFNYDWFDPKFLTFLNSVLEDQKIEKRLMAFGNWNICMITLQPPAWMEKFKTLLPMDIEIF